jgi:hypothetical protein
MPHLSFPVAETAVHGALAGDEKENPVRIAVGQTWDRRQLLLVQRVIKAFFIRDFPKVRHGLLVEGICLSPDEANSFQFFRLVELQEFGEIER